MWRFSCVEDRLRIQMQEWGDQNGVNANRNTGSSKCHRTGAGKWQTQGDRAKRDDRTKAQRWHMEAQRYTEELKLVWGICANTLFDFTKCGQTSPLCSRSLVVCSDATLQTQAAWKKTLSPGNPHNQHFFSLFLIVLSRTLKFNLLTEACRS